MNITILNHQSYVKYSHHWRYWRALFCFCCFFLSNWLFIWHDLFSEFSNLYFRGCRKILASRLDVTITFITKGSQRLKLNSPETGTFSIQLMEPRVYKWTLSKRTVTLQVPVEGKTRFIPHWRKSETGVWITSANPHILNIFKSHHWKLITIYINAGQQVSPIKSISDIQ